MKAAWLLALAAVPLMAAAADDPALARLDECRARLDARTDIGFERIEKRCPGLLVELEKAPWHPLLPAGLRERRDEVSAESLRQLADLVRASRVESKLRDAPDTRELAPVLAELGDQGQQGATRWERFKRWLREKFERRESKDEDKWLKDLARQFETSEGVARVITYVGYAALAVLVLFVVWSELRAAGIVGAGRRARAAARWAAGGRHRLQLSDVAAAPLADRPGLLLRLLGETLTRGHRLPAPDGLTAAAIARRARLDDELDRAGLQAVAKAADAVRYGATHPGDEVLAGAEGTARALLGKFGRLKPVKH